MKLQTRIIFIVALALSACMTSCSLVQRLASPDPPVAPVVTPFTLLQLRIMERMASPTPAP